MNEHTTGCLAADSVPAWFESPAAQLLEALQDAAFVVDTATSRLMAWNPAAEKAFGYTAAEAVGMPLAALMPSFEALEALVAGAGPVAIAARPKHGGDRWVEATGSVLPALGEARPVVVVARDAGNRAASAARWERTQEAERQQALLASIIDHAPAGIAYLDRDLVIRWVNPEYQRLTLRDAEALCGRYMFEGVDATARARFEPALRSVFTTGQPFRAQAMPHLMVVDGVRHQTHWDVNYVPIFGDAGAVEGLMILALEVSERIEREQLQGERIAALEEADRLKDQFLTILSHELRTPLNAVMGFASVLDDEVVGPMTPEQHAFLRRILGGTETLLSLINDLLDMSRIQAGKFSLAPAPTAIAEVCEAVLENLAHSAERKGQRLSAELPDDLPRVSADAQRVAQVLTNLVANAVKFTPEGGAIEVRLGQDGTGVRCEVRDNGVGIAEADLPKLFRPFVQLDASATREAGGTGLGLSISRALVEAHGGAIGVESAPGVGSTFWFVLPG